jgi:S-methylmethionine-dependent homocysteine/selenocysteine methylase
MSYRNLQERLDAGQTVLLDGGTGSEVLRRRAQLPVALWAVGPLLNAPEMLRQIHETYIAAGAEIITTATFRTQARALRQVGREHEAPALTRRAVEVAEQARARAHSGREVLIAGSMAPLEDCYEPGLVPPDAELRAEHEAHARNLAEGGVDFLLAETMNTVREARAALLAGLQTGLPVWVSLTCTAGARLRSGEPIKAAMDALLPLAPSALLVNCSSPEHTTEALAALGGLHTVPLGAYANNGHPLDAAGWSFTGEYPPPRYVEEARRWRKRGARILGGCCGTTPEHIRALREDLDAA